MSVSRSGGFEDSTYAVTKTDVVNQTGDRTFATFTVPGGTWRDGEVVNARMIAIRKNDTGSDQNATLKVQVTGSALTTIGGAITWTAGASEEFVYGLMSFFRGETGVYIPTDHYNTGVAGAISARPLDIIADNSVFSVGTGFLTLTPTSFDADILITLAVNLSAANVNMYFKPRHIGAYKTNFWSAIG